MAENTMQSFSEVGSVVVKTTENGKKVTHKVEHKCSITPKDNLLMSFGREDEIPLVEIRQKDGNLGLIISPEVINNIGNDELKALLQNTGIPNGPVVLTCKNDKTAPIKINSTQNQFIVEVAGQDNVIKEYKCTITPVGINFECENDGKKLSGEYRSPELKPINVQMSEKFISLALSKKDKVVSGLNVADMPRHLAVPTLKLLLSQEMSKGDKSEIHQFDLANDVFETTPAKNHSCKVLAYNPGGDTNPENAYYFITETVGNKRTNFVLHNGKPVKVKDIIVEVSQETGKPTIYLSHSDKSKKVFQTSLEFGKSTKNGPRMSQKEIDVMQNIVSFYGAEIAQNQKDATLENVSSSKGSDFLIPRGSKRPANALDPMGGKNRTARIDLTDDLENLVDTPPIDDDDQDDNNKNDHDDDDNDQDDDEKDEEEDEDEKDDPIHVTDDHDEPEPQKRPKKINPLEAAEAKLRAMNAADDEKAKERDKAIKKKATPALGVSVAVAGFILMMMFPMIGPLAVILGGALSLAGGVWFTIADRFANPYIQLSRNIDHAIARAQEHGKEKEHFLENDRAIDKESNMIAGLEAQIQDIQNDDSLTDTEKLEKIALIERQINDAKERIDAVTLEQNDAIANMSERDFNSLLKDPDVSDEKKAALIEKYGYGIVRRLNNPNYPDALRQEFVSSLSGTALQSLQAKNTEYINAIKGVDDTAKDFVDRQNALTALVQVKSVYDLCEKNTKLNPAPELVTREMIVKDVERFLQVADQVAQPTAQHSLEVISQQTNIPLDKLKEKFDDISSKELSSNLDKLQELYRERETALQNADFYSNIVENELEPQCALLGTNPTFKTSGLLYKTKDEKIQEYASQSQKYLNEESIRTDVDTAQAELESWEKLKSGTKNDVDLNIIEGNIKNAEQKYQQARARTEIDTNYDDYLYTWNFSDAEFSKDFDKNALAEIVGKHKAMVKAGELTKQIDDTIKKICENYKSIEIDGKQIDFSYAVSNGIKNELAGELTENYDSCEKECSLRLKVYGKTTLPILAAIPDEKRNECAEKLQEIASSTDKTNSEKWESTKTLINEVKNPNYPAKTIADMENFHKEQTQKESQKLAKIVGRENGNRMLNNSVARQTGHYVLDSQPVKGSKTEQKYIEAKEGAQKNRAAMAYIKDLYDVIASQNTTPAELHIALRQLKRTLNKVEFDGDIPKDLAKVLNKNKALNSTKPNVKQVQKLKETVVKKVENTLASDQATENKNKNKLQNKDKREIIASASVFADRADGLNTMITKETNSRQTTVHYVQVDKPIAERQTEKSQSREQGQE